MKPIKLTIEGLNSFETKQELDFESLATGVFGIFGKTGSGKSTILDAITLSLYGKVERTKLCSDFINTKCSKATVSFVFEINKKTFEITRTFSKKKNGKDTDSYAQLFEIVDGDKKIIAEGSVKVNDKIFQIIGLGVNEFVKCIALPQGEFAAFLQAKPSERTEIMSNIFNLSRYGEDLISKVKEKLAEYDKQVATLSASVELVKYANDDKLNKLTESLENNKTEYEKQSNKLKELSNVWGEQKQNFEKLQTLNKIKTELAELEKQKEEISKIETEIEKSQAANQIKTLYEKLKEDEADIKELSTKIAELGESKLQKQSQVVESESNFNLLKDSFDTRVVELNTRLAKLQELAKYEEEIKKAQEKKDESLSLVEQKEKEVAEESQNNDYLENNISKLQEEIDEIDEFIGSNKADVELTYALEQTKGIESEIILIDELIGKIESMIDQTNADLKDAHNQYNEEIANEKKLRDDQEKIEQSIAVAFEDADTTNFAKLRSCDKQLEGMREVISELGNIDNIISKLTLENEQRQATITQVETDIVAQQKKLTEIDDLIIKKEVELGANQTERESLLGENVISMISEHLQVGDLCPVCSSQITTKIYSDKNDFSYIETEIDLNKQGIKNLRYERDKILAGLVSLKSRIEFEKSQIDKNNNEISSLFTGKRSFYLKYVDDNDESAENFEKLYNLIKNTVSSLENLINLQEDVRYDEKQALIRKTQAGTRITIYKSYLDELSETLYALQKKKAEREFVILNVNEKYQNLAEYKKQIAEGKNIELVIDSKKESRAKLKDRQFELASEKSKSDLKIATTLSEIGVLQERISICDETIADNRKKILSSGVPENVSVESEKAETENTIDNLKIEFKEKQSLFETSKEELARVSNDYEISSSILQTKQNEVESLTLSLNESLENNSFKDFAELERCFADSNILKTKQEKVDEYKNNYRLLETQVNALESDEILSIDEKQIFETEKEINKLNKSVKELTETIGKLGAEVERTSIDNAKLKEFSADLEKAKHGYDTAKELSTVLRGKALAEYVCEEYLQQITDSANEKLEILMDGRYTLKFENKEFFVEDNFNDGQTRSASTLSGGETFVVSLSLALSISDAISMLSSRNMEFFFLDEGFGTLDSELCSVVISSLYKLESQNLKIGLISHVAELEESIKNKVIVTKGKNGTELRLEHSL